MTCFYKMPVVFLGSITNSSLLSGIWDFKIDCILHIQYWQSFSKEELSRGESLYYHQLPLSQFTDVHKYQSVKIYSPSRKYQVWGHNGESDTERWKPHREAAWRASMNRGWADRLGARHEAVRGQGREKTTVGHTSSLFISNVKINLPYQVISFPVP